MVINKRLINELKESKKYIILNVIAQWIGLLANIGIMISIAYFLRRIYLNKLSLMFLESFIYLMIILIALKMLCAYLSLRFSYLSSKKVKTILRKSIYEKLLKLGMSYRNSFKTSEIVQLAIEGIEQLENYFGSYLPQLFYALVAPITLFIILCFINLPSAFVLFICVPLIPITIIVIQRWASRLLSKYWTQYTNLGDTFLENLQGLLTTKIYQSDEYYHQKMNEESENFRKITMKVLRMQLNSITIMDLVAYGGTALGIILALYQYQNSSIDLMVAIMTILLAADFFLPMRLLGSYFHIAMNGLAASKKIFKLLDLDDDNSKNSKLDHIDSIKINGLSYYYDERQVLNKINMNIDKHQFIGIIGESGSGKSTIANILMKRNKNYLGNIKINNIELDDISNIDLMNHISYVGHLSHIFKGSVKDNLKMVNQELSDYKMWEALTKVKLDEVFESLDGLDTLIEENANNLSLGQKQRLALARAILADSSVYIFDEVTSNIDVESENQIVKVIKDLSREKTVILITHRLKNIINADSIYVLDKGILVESGQHERLIKDEGIYRELFNTQEKLESYIGG